MKKVVDAIGRGMTRRNQAKLVFDGPGTGEEVAALRKAFMPAKDWAWLEREARTARNTLEAILRGETGDDGEAIFEPHHGAGWYSREILRRIRYVENAREAEDIHEVARQSFNLAVLLTELRMKIAWEHDVEAALSTEEERSRGGRNSCKVPAHMQLSTWQHFLSKRGSARRAINLLPTDLASPLRLFGGRAFKRKKGQQLATRTGPSPYMPWLPRTEWPDHEAYPPT